MMHNTFRVWYATKKPSPTFSEIAVAALIIIRESTHARTFSLTHTSRLYHIFSNLRPLLLRWVLSGFWEWRQICNGQSFLVRFNVLYQPVHRTWCTYTTFHGLELIHVCTASNEIDSQGRRLRRLSRREETRIRERLIPSKGVLEIQKGKQNEILYKK